MRAADLIAQLSQRADLEYVEPDYVLYAASTPNDPWFANQWALRNAGQVVNGWAGGTSGADVHAAAAWDIASGSPANVVGIVDTAFDVRHPDLAPNVWSAPASFTVVIGGTSIACPAGTHGFQSQSGVLSCGPGAAMEHATHVAGIIGAAGNNQQGVAGINWRASMMSLNFMPDGTSGYTSDAINAIEFAIQMKARFAGWAAGNVRVLNNSWGGSAFSQALQDEIDRAGANDMLFVTAAGNSGANIDTSPNYPASLARPNMVTVASSNAYEQVSDFSNYGQATVHLAAPGENIVSTFPGGGYGYLSGTSMAAPMVSGAAALILSRCPMNTSDLKSLLLNSVDRLSQYAVLTMTGGRLNIARALQTCAAGAADAPPSVALTSPADGARYFEPVAAIRVAASAIDSDGSIARVDFYSGSMAIGSATVGFVKVPEFLAPVFRLAEAAARHPDWLPVAATLVAVLGIAGAYWLYLMFTEAPARIRAAVHPAERVLEEKYGFDLAYDAFADRVVVDGSRRVLWEGLDEAVIDGAVNGAGSLTAGLSRVVRLVQTGLVRGYALLILGGAVTLVGYLLWTR